MNLTGSIPAAFFTSMVDLQTLILDENPVSLPRSLIGGKAACLLIVCWLQSNRLGVPLVCNTWVTWQGLLHYQSSTSSCCPVKCRQDTHKHKSSLPSKCKQHTQGYTTSSLVNVALCKVQKSTSCVLLSTSGLQYAAWPWPSSS